MSLQERTQLRADVFRFAAAVPDLFFDAAPERLDLAADVVGLPEALARLFVQGGLERFELGSDRRELLLDFLPALAETREGHRDVVLGSPLPFFAGREPFPDRSHLRLGLLPVLGLPGDLFEPLGQRLLLFGQRRLERSGVALELAEPGGELLCLFPRALAVFTVPRDLTERLLELRLQRPNPLLRDAGRGGRGSRGRNDRLARRRRGHASGGRRGGAHHLSRRRGFRGRRRTRTRRTLEGKRRVGFRLPGLRPGFRRRLARVERGLLGEGRHECVRPILPRSRRLPGRRRRAGEQRVFPGQQIVRLPADSCRTGFGLFPLQAAEQIDKGQLRDQLEGLRHAPPGARDRFHERIRRKAEGLLERVQREDVRQVALVVLDDDRDSLEGDAVCLQVVFQVLPALEVLGERRPLRVGDEHDPVGPLEYDPARLVERGLARNGGEL